MVHSSISYMKIDKDQVDCFQCKYVSRYALESPVPPADLIALSPGYRVPPDLATVPHAPLAYVVYAPGGRNIGSNVQNDVASSVM